MKQLVQQQHIRFFNGPAVGILCVAAGATRHAVTYADRPQAYGATISGVDPAAGLSGLSVFGTLLGRTLNDSMVRNWDVRIHAEESSESPSWSYAPPDIMSDSIPRGGVNRIGPGSPEQALLLYQTSGDDITMSTRNLTTGEWTTVAWPIPED